MFDDVVQCVHTGYLTASDTAPWTVCHSSWSLALILQVRRSSLHIHLSELFHTQLSIAQCTCRQVPRAHRQGLTPMPF